MIRATRSTLHLARPEDAPVEVRRLEWESEWHYGERVRAIHALGARWVRHPGYVPLMRHSWNLELWQHARREFVASITEAAALARAKNPAFKRAQAVRNAIEAA